ncbi:MAG: hypothetical protein NZM34_13775, partial [Bernardetiaceae bacterium]|nr:hypothetical protein [Bernardetiaceae bacterium]
MRNNLLAGLLMFTCLYSCGKKEQVRQEMIPPVNGLSILFHERHLDARKPQLKDVLWLRYAYIGPFGDTIMHTYRPDFPGKYATVEPKDYVEQELLLPPYPGAIEEALAQVAVGDSLTVFLHRDSVMKHT